MHVFGENVMQAYMSLLNLFMNDANIEKDGKLATLWFDKLLLGVDDDLINKTISYVADREKWSKDTLQELLKIQVSSKSLLPDISFFDESINKDKSFDTAIQIMSSKYEKELECPKTRGGAMHEVAMSATGIATTVKYWTLLNAKSSCTFLPMELEQQMLKKLFSDTVDGNFESFSNVMAGTIPDVSNYSWDKIIEMRHHEFWKAFRNKITALSDSYADEVLSKEIFNEIVNKDLKEMAQQLRPNIKTDIAKCVFSNFPLPIPVNPVSIVCSGRDILKEINFKKKYGWIYFYLDL